MSFIENLIAKVKEVLAPNRLAAIVVFLSALSAQIAALSGVFPAGSDLAQALVPVGALITQAITVVKWLEGWQKHEARQAVADSVGIAPAATPVDPVAPPPEFPPGEDALGPLGTDEVPTDQPE